MCYDLSSPTVSETRQAATQARRAAPADSQPWTAQLPPLSRPSSRRNSVASVTSVRLLRLNDVCKPQRAKSLIISSTPSAKVCE